MANICLYVHLMQNYCIEDKSVLNVLADKGPYLHFIHTQTHTHTYVFKHMHTHTYVYVCTQYMHTHVFAHPYVHTYM